MVVKVLGEVSFLRAQQCEREGRGLVTEVEIEEWSNPKRLPEGNGFRGWRRERGVSLA